jgi:hypothetical protein
MFLYGGLLAPPIWLPLPCVPPSLPLTYSTPCKIQSCPLEGSALPPFINLSWYTVYRIQGAFNPDSSVLCSKYTECTVYRVHRDQTNWYAQTSCPSEHKSCVKSTYQGVSVSHDTRIGIFEDSWDTGDSPLSKCGVEPVLPQLLPLALISSCIAFSHQFVSNVIAQLVVCWLSNHLLPVCSVFVHRDLRLRPADFRLIFASGVWTYHA